MDGKFYILQAKKKWVRAQSDRSINGYIVFTAEGNISEPEWPDKSIADYLSTAFADAIIDDENHPIVKRLRGLS